MQNNIKYAFTLTQFWLINAPTYFMNLMNEVFMEQIRPIHSGIY